MWHGEKCTELLNFWSNMKFILFLLLVSEIGLLFVLLITIDDNGSFVER
jgi:AAA+ ATPase superfamily predicted ATPase